MNQLVEATLDALVARIESGTGKWVKDWIGGGMPANWTTKKNYHGVNTLLLWDARARAGYPTSQWATYKQWQGAGRQVRQGEKSAVIFIAKDALKKGGDPANSDDHYRLLKCAFVFNAAQLTEPPEIVTGQVTGHEKIDRCEAIVKATGAMIGNGDTPLYRPSADIILIPPLSKFLTVEGYYVTLFHELVHWTGHKNRLDRNDLSYATEELVAELGATFLCAELGIEKVEDNAAAYLRSWLQHIKLDKGRALMRAAAAASKAHEFILVSRETKEDLAMAS